MKKKVDYMIRGTHGLDLKRFVECAQPFVGYSKLIMIDGTGKTGGYVMYRLTKAKFKLLVTLFNEYNWCRGSLVRLYRGLPTEKNVKCLDVIEGGW